MSIGILRGFQTQSNPSFSMLKLGQILKYYYWIMLLLLKKKLEFP